MKYINFKRFKFPTIFKKINFPRYNFSKLFKFIEIGMSNFKNAYKYVHFDKSSFLKLFKIIGIKIYNFSRINKINFRNSNFLLFHLPAAIVFFAGHTYGVASTHKKWLGLVALTTFKVFLKFLNLCARKEK